MLAKKSGAAAGSFGPAATAFAARRIATGAPNAMIAALSILTAALIADGASAHLMKSGQVQWLVVGADRICANGDTANKIGTLSLAVAARHFGARFMVVAPTSTVDFGTADGSAIHIEERDPRELTEYAGVRVAAPGVAAWNPVFDVTPASLIDVIVTERGAVERPDAERMRALR